MKKVDMFIGCKRKDVATRNLKYLTKLKGNLLKMRAVQHSQTNKKFKPQISHKDGNVGSTSLMNDLLLKIGAQIMIVNNIDTLDQLTNGQIGSLEDIIRREDKKIEILIIKLKDSNAGKSNMSQHPNLSLKYPNCVFIRRISMQYSIRKKTGDVGSMATVIQFPVRLAHVITAHKIQGITIPYLLFLLTYLKLPRPM